MCLYSLRVHPRNMLYVSVTIMILQIKKVAIMRSQPGYPPRDCIILLMQLLVRVNIVIHGNGTSSYAPEASTMILGRKLLMLTGLRIRLFNSATDALDINMYGKPSWKDT
jgi:hypothetical protein